MSPPRCLRPIILPAAHHLPLVPYRFFYSPIIHQNHFRRTQATLRPPYRSLSYSRSAGFAIAAALFGAANATKTAPSDDFLEEINLIVYAEIRAYLGCQNILFVPSPPVASDVEMVVFLDADATSEDGKGTVVGVRLTSFGRNEVEMVGFLRQILEGCEDERLLRKQGKAVCHLSCSDADGIWFYGGAGVEVPGAHLRPWGKEGGWLKRIITIKSLDLGNMCDWC